MLQRISVHAFLIAYLIWSALIILYIFSFKYNMQTSSVNQPRKTFIYMWQTFQTHDLNEQQQWQRRTNSWQIPTKFWIKWNNYTLTAPAETENLVYNKSLDEKNHNFNESYNTNLQQSNRHNPKSRDNFSETLAITKPAKTCMYKTNRTKYHKDCK